MLRISKLTDYAVALTTHLARCQVGPRAPGNAEEPGDLQHLVNAATQQPHEAGAHEHGGAHEPMGEHDGEQDGAHEPGHEPAHEPGHESVRALAAATGVPEPTVRKVLKTLAHAGIVCSLRGTHGGYALACPAADISVAEVVIAVEGPIAVPSSRARPRPAPAISRAAATCRARGSASARSSATRSTSN